MVWTYGGGTELFEAFDTNNISLGTIAPLGVADTVYSGQTGEDRSYCVTHAGGIGPIFINHSFGGIEVDHVQYGDMASAVPVPASLPLLLAGVGGMAFLRRRSHS